MFSARLKNLFVLYIDMHMDERIPKGKWEDSVCGVIIQMLSSVPYCQKSKATESRGSTTDKDYFNDQDCKGQD